MRSYPLLRKGLGLQAVKLLLGLRKAQPTQAIEKIVGIVARGYGVRSVYKGFVGFIAWQQGLGYCHKVCLFGCQAGMQGFRLLLPCLKDLVSSQTPWLKPYTAIEHFQINQANNRHPNSSPARKGLRLV